MTIHQIAFSPTGGTRRVSELLCSGIEAKSILTELCVKEEELCLPSIAAGDLVVVSMPENWHPLAEPFLRGCKAANRSAVSHCQATARTSKAAADLFLWQTKTVRNAVSARANARQVQYLPTIQKTTTTSSASAVCGACRSARRMREASASI